VFLKESVHVGLAEKGPLKHLQDEEFTPVDTEIVTIFIVQIPEC